MNGGFRLGGFLRFWQTLITRNREILSISGVVVCVVVIVGITGYPFNFTVPTGRGLGEWLFLFPGTETARGIGENILLFVPLGFALSVWLTARHWRIKAILFTVFAVSLALSYTIEFTQHFLPSRFPSRLDLLANSLGGFLAVGLHQLWLCSRPAIVLVYAVAVVAVSVPLQSWTTLRNWDESIPLVLANEARGGRLWRGEMRNITFLDTVLSASELADASSPLPILGGYRFGDNPIPSAIGSAPVLLRQVATTGSGGVTWFRSAHPPSELVRRIKRRNRFTLLATVTPEDLDQSGPARIVTLSSGPSNRNLTLGQSGADLVVRLRTRLTGTNGIRPELIIANVFEARKTRSIAVTYDGSTLRVFRDGQPCEPALHVHPAWMLHPGRSVASSMGGMGIRLLYYALLFAPLGILLFIALRAEPGRPAIPGGGWSMAAGVVIGSVALDMLLAQVGARGVQTGNICSVILCTGFGVLLAGSASGFWLRFARSKGG